MPKNVSGRRNWRDRNEKECGSVHESCGYSCPECGGCTRLEEKKRGENFCFRRVMGAVPEVKQGWYSDTQYQQATPLDCHRPCGQRQPSGSLLGE